MNTFLKTFSIGLLASVKGYNIVEVIKVWSECIELMKSWIRLRLDITFGFFICLIGIYQDI